MPKYQHPSVPEQYPQNDKYEAKNKAWLLAWQLYNYGFNVFPLAYKTKDRPFGSWTAYQTRKATEEELDAWSEQHPGCNWAVLCGETSQDLVVFDCDDADAIEWAEKHLPETPFKVKTGHGIHFYYRLPEAMKDWIKKFIPRKQIQYKGAELHADIRRQGNYVIAPGSTHPEGAVYELMNGFPDWETVPAFRLIDVKDPGVPPLNDIDDEIDIDLSDVDNLDNVVATCEDVYEGGRNNALAHLVGVLLTYTEPAKNLRKLYNLVGEWNTTKCHPPLPNDEVRRTVESILKKEQAKQAAEQALGFKPRKNRPLISAAEASNMDGLKYLEGEELDTAVSIPIPDALLNPIGCLKPLQQYIMDSAVRTTPLFATIGALALVSTMACWKIISPTNLVTNNMFVCVGPSSCGKNAPKSAAIRLLKKFAPGLLGANDVASDAALVNRLAKKTRHIGLFVWDEIGMLLKGCKKANSTKAGLVKTITESFSNAVDGFDKIYADEGNNKDVPWHGFNLLGLSVPNEFFGSLSDGEAVNGFFARIMTFVDQSSSKTPRKSSVLMDIPQEIATIMERLNAFTPPKEVIPPDDSRDEELRLDPKFKPIRCLLTPEADKFWHDKTEAYGVEQERHEEEGKMMLASMEGRLGEHAMKMALVGLYAMEMDNIVNNHTITLEIMKWAWDIVDYAYKGAASAASLAISSTDFEEVCNAIRKVMRQTITRNKSKAASSKSTNNFVPGPTMAQMSRGTAQYPQDIVEKAIAKMVESHEIRFQPDFTSSGKSRRKLGIYRFIKEVDEDEAPAEAPKAGV